MSTNPEIRSLFATLASNLQTLHPTARDELDLSISNLNRSLNLTEARVLDTALSLMGFHAPQVYDLVTEYTVRTIVSVLSASIDCKVLRIDKEQVLRVGGSIGRSECDGVLQGFADMLGKLGGYRGDLCSMLLCTVIRTAAFAPSFSCPTPSASNLEMKSGNASISVFATLLGHIPTDLKFMNHEIPLRLLLWHLDPMILKQDILQMLQESIKRPFLDFRMKIYDAVEWRSKLICLIMSPSMFVETRSLLHNWFLKTGLAHVLELQITFVSQALDIISRPTWWGIPVEVGSKLPFSRAYFPHEHHLLRILAGPISHEYFQHLINKVSGSISRAGGHLHTPSSMAATKTSSVDYKSMWAMAMNFPGWFFFASILLFRNNSAANSSNSGSIPIKPYVMHEIEVSCSVGAAKFIAWILNPTSEYYLSQTVDFLVKVSESWALKLSSSNKYKKTRKPRLNLKDALAPTELNGHSVLLWLKEFQDMYIKHFETIVAYSNSSTKRFTTHQNLMWRRIPLGILLAYPNHLNAAGCALLLHYAATGTVRTCSEILNSGEDSIAWIEEYTKTEAIAGSKIVFNLTDEVESICSSVFEAEVEGLDFVCRLKLKTGNYLLMCIKRLLQLNLIEDGSDTRGDLLSRVVRWRSQGKDVFDLDCVCVML